MPSYPEQQEDQYRDERNNQPQRQPVHRGLTYATNNQHNHHPPPPAGTNQKRRVQIVDHTRHTPSTVHNDYASGRQSHNSTNGHPNTHRTPTSDMNRSKVVKSHSHPDQSDDNRHGHHAGQNSRIHDLYGPAAPEPGKY